MHFRLLILSVFISAACFAQSAKTDTVKQGFYLPLDSNMMSCRIEITPRGKKTQMTNNTGNKIPDSTISIIGHLEPGSVVIYSELTVLNNGKFEKAPPVRYVIGARNTKLVKRDPSYPDTLTAKEISTIILDPHVTSFSVSWILNGAMYEYHITGNGVSGEARSGIEALPAGTKVYFENIQRKEDNGTVRHQPDEIHVVR